MKRSFVTDIHECERLWHALITPQYASDLWEFRFCFQKHFKRQPSFMVLEDRWGIAGMLPLSYLPEEDTFVLFPGEIWKGKTWNERTPLYTRHPDVLSSLFDACPEKSYLRYLELPDGYLSTSLELDEIGYVLYPGNLEFEMANFRKRFSSKRFKGITKAIRDLNAGEGQFHINRVEDYALLVEMSLQSFGADSYLHDARFRDSFRDVMGFLQRGGWLRMVSLELEGVTRAVDLGAVYRGNYTVFLGGTDCRVPGVAKVMNMHHIEFALQQHLSKVDFLCGDFHWKKLWHLDPEPLYKHVTVELPVRDEPGFTLPDTTSDMLQVHA